jgi:hypothetical protein
LVRYSFLLWRLTFFILPLDMDIETDYMRVSSS